MRYIAISLSPLVVVAQALVSSAVNQKTATDMILPFDQWLDAVGVERQVSIQDDTNVGGGRGLVASRRMEPGEVAAFVPASATLRLEGGYHDEGDNWAGVLAVNLMHQREIGLGSPLYSYLQFGLPKEAPTTPCRWSSRDRLVLQNSTFVEECLRNSVWRRQQALLHGGSNCKSFMHMIDLVCSRTLRGRDGSRQMVPLIDMANHAPEEGGGGHFSVDDRGNVALIVGRRGVNKGEPVTMDYGARTVEDFLLHYGFVPARCSSDTVLVDCGDGPLHLSWKDCEGYRGHNDDVVREFCWKKLQTFPTSVQDDLSFMKTMPNDVSEALRSALSYRISKKSLLSGLAGLHSFSL